MLRRPVARVGAGLFDQRERLEAAALHELAARVGEEAVEERIARVLGQVDDAGGGIDGGGLVREAAHGGERDGLGEARVGGGDFEDEAVGLAGVGAGHELGFLAGEPGTPGRGSAAAIDRRAGERKVRALDALCREVDQRGGGSARVRTAGGVGVVDECGIDRAAGGEGAVGVRLVADAEFVVADEKAACRIALDRESGHAVMRGGLDEAVGHAIAARERTA